MSPPLLLSTPLHSSPLLSSPLHSHQDQVTKVFLGAYSMLSNGGLVSRVGTAVVASMAHEYLLNSLSIVFYLSITFVCLPHISSSLIL